MNINYSSKFLLLFSLAAVLALGACEKPEEKASRYIKRGNELFENGQLEKARIEYKNAARIKPTDPEIDYRFGLLDEAEGDIRGAFDAFTAAQQQDAHFAPALIKLSEYYLTAGREDEAEKRIAVVLTDKPDNADALAMHGALLLREKDLAGAEKEARTALSHDNKNIYAHTVLAGVYSTKEDNDDALKTLNEGIEHNPKELSLYLLKANIFERSQDLAKTAEVYQDIFKLAPDKPQYRAKLAVIYLNAGRIDEAEKTLRDACAAFPNNWDMKHDLVTFLNEHRGFDAAEKEIRSYIQANPSKGELNNWLVDLYISHNATDKAVDFLKQVIANNQADTQGLNAKATLARINYLQGDKTAAEQLVSDVLQHDPNNLDARFIKAHIEFDKGYYQNTISDLRGIIRDHPKSKEALHLLSETLLIQGHLDLAIDTLSQLVELDPLNQAARVRLAQMYHQNGESKRAMDILFFITKTEPKYPVAWESVARIAIDTKDWTSAETAIDALDKLEGQHLTAVFLRGAMLQSKDNPKEAVEQYKQVIEADPSSPLAEHALNDLVLAYRSLNTPDEATKYIASLKSASPVVHTILGESDLASGNASEAAANFDNAIAAHSSRQEPYLDRAKLYIFDHKLDEAIKVLKQGAEAAPTDIRAPILEAELLTKMGNYKDAETIYDQLLDRNPELDGVANNLAELIADYQADDSQALAKAHRVAERFSASTNPLLLDTLAWVYYREGNTDQAQLIMQREMTQGTDLPPQIHYHNAAILLKIGHKEAAKEELKKATANDVQPYPGLEEAKQMFKGL